MLQSFSTLPVGERRPLHAHSVYLPCQMLQSFCPVLIKTQSAVQDHSSIGQHFFGNSLVYTAAFGNAFVLHIWKYLGCAFRWTLVWYNSLVNISVSVGNTSRLHVVALHVSHFLSMWVCFFVVNVRLCLTLGREENCRQMSAPRTTHNYQVVCVCMCVCVCVCVCICVCASVSVCMMGIACVCVWCVWWVV